MYTPTPKTAYEIVTNTNLKLPRFQRKQAWKDADRFKLCISLFKGYPLGTIVERRENKISWLLDGRQRRDTLVQMLDPVNVYKWAQSFLKFKIKDDESEIKRLFYHHLNEFLYKGDESEEKHKDDELEEETFDIGEINEDADSESGKESFSSISCILDQEDEKELEDLLFIILSVHKTTDKSSEFTKPFDFNDYGYRPQYYKNNEEGEPKVNSTKLSNWILGKNISNADSMTYEDAISMFDAYPDVLINVIEKRFEKIKISVKCVNIIRDKLKETPVSVISLDEHCRPSDARKIFEIINKQGVALTNAEILSAKPQWNRRINEPRLVLLKETEKLYKGMGVEYSGDVVSWDVAATFTSRLSEYSDYIFGSLRTISFDSNDKNSTKNIDKKVNYGFKLLAGRYVRDISKTGVESLANCDVDWNSSEFENEIESVTKMLHKEDSFIRHFGTYKHPLSDLIGDTVAINYILALIDKFTKDKPGTSQSKARKQFLVNSRILLDRLFYEYAKGEWAGSSDSRLKKNLEQPNELFRSVPDADWDALIDEVYVNNRIGGQQTKKKRIVALLYYFTALMNKNLNLMDEDYPEVDHIIPDSEFVNTSSNRNFKDSLINHALLSGLLNKKKNNTFSALDAPTKEEIARLEDVSVDTLEKLQNSGNFELMFKERIAIKDRIKKLRSDFVKGEGFWELKA